MLLPVPRSIRTSGRRVPYPAEGVSESVDRSLPPQGYRIVAGQGGVSVEAPDDSGFRHARATVEQLRHRANSGFGAGSFDPGGRTIPECEITDWPDHLVRGVMLDVSRDKVPTVETLEAMLERLASWKINHVELYMEHTFAYDGHEEVWAEADPFTASDLARLDRHCTSLGMELVPNQNTLGHFERWLSHDRYRPLAISPDGFDWLFGIRRGPSTIEPRNGGSFSLVADLLSQLSAALDKPRFHIGLDEPWELDSSRWAEWSGWLERLSGLDPLRGRELLVWGDLPAAHPELMDRMARLGGSRKGAATITVCEWGYEANHPFEERASRLSSSGLGFWVCPGTSSWMSISGRSQNMLENIRGAAHAGASGGAAGFLITDWGDFGHLQYLPVSDPGFAAGACLSWCSTSHAGLDLDGLATMLDAHAYDDPRCVTGHAVVALGSVHRLVTPQPPNMSAFVGNILFPQLPVGKLMTRGLTVTECDHFEEGVSEAVASLHESRTSRPDGDLVIRELRAASELLRLAATDARLRLRGDGCIRSIAAAERERLAEWCGAIAENHRELWLARNRMGGLEDSSAWLEHLGSCYASGEAERGWFGTVLNVR